MMGGNIVSFFKKSTIKMKKILFLIFKKGVKLFSGYRFSQVYPIKVIWPKIFHFLFSNLYPNSAVKVGDHKMILDSNDSFCLLIDGVYQPLGVKLLKKVIKKGDVIVVGAHIGYYTLLFAKLVGEDGKVFAFEPDPNNFALLKKNVEINGYKNVVLEQKAVTNKTGKIRLYLSDENKSAHTIYPPNNYVNSIEVEAIRLDDYFKNYNGEINFIKISATWSDAGVIQGMPNLLRKYKNLNILIRFSAFSLEEYCLNLTNKEFLKFVQEYNFKFYYINEQENKIELINIRKSRYLPTIDGSNVLVTRMKMI